MDFSGGGGTDFSGMGGTDFSGMGGTDFSGGGNNFGTDFSGGGGGGTDLGLGGIAGMVGNVNPAYAI